LAVALKEALSIRRCLSSVDAQRDRLVPTMEPTDDSLLEAWRAGDRSAGEQLFERHYEALYRFYSRKTSVDVADLVQKTSLALVEGRERYRGDASARTFLFAIARNQLLVHFRGRRRDAALDFSVQSLHDLDPTPSQALFEKQDNRVLLEALRRIPLDLQIAIELHYWEGLHGPELARILDVPEGTVRSRLRRGLEMLRAQVANLATSPDALTTTLSNLDRWAERVREQA
jgi:RNA polymerase sigma factor (sigma-70 family)